MSSQYDKAMKLAKEKKPDFDKVSKLLEKGHQNDDFRATYALATWYIHGTFYEKNISKGTALLKVAAENNIPESQFDLAYSYEVGIGVEKNEQTAFKWYLKSALLGDRQALHEVGRCYYYGIGIAESRELADVFLEVAEHFGADGIHH